MDKTIACMDGVGVEVKLRFLYIFHQMPTLHFRAENVNKHHPRIIMTCHDAPFITIIDSKRKCNNDQV